MAYKLKSMFVVIAAICAVLAILQPHRKPPLDFTVTLLPGPSHEELMEVAGEVVAERIGLFRRPTDVCRQGRVKALPQNDSEDSAVLSGVGFVGQYREFCIEIHWTIDSNRVPLGEYDPVVMFYTRQPDGTFVGPMLATPTSGRGFFEYFTPIDSSHCELKSHTSNMSSKPLLPGEYRHVSILVAAPKDGGDPILLNAHEVRCIFEKKNHLDR